MISIFVPVKLVSEANRQMEHWGARQRRKKKQQEAVKWALYARTTPPRWPVHVVLTRVGGHKMDSDNLAACFKHVQDAVAKFIGVDDGDDSAVTWEYQQQKGKQSGQLGCYIELAAVKAARET